MFISCIERVLLWSRGTDCVELVFLAWSGPRRCLCVRTERRFLYMSASQWEREVLWSILSVIQGCLWRFPFPLSGSRRWDHRTSLHRWQPRLKVSRSRGAYRLLARCEILPRMLFLPVPDPLLPQRDVISLLTRGRAERKMQFVALLLYYICCSAFFFLTLKRMKKKKKGFTSHQDHFSRTRETFKEKEKCSKQIQVPLLTLLPHITAVKL